MIPPKAVKMDFSSIAYCIPHPFPVNPHSTRCFSSSPQHTPSNAFGKERCLPWSNFISFSFVSSHPLLFPETSYRIQSPRNPIPPIVPSQHTPFPLSWSHSLKLTIHLLLPSFPSISSLSITDLPRCLSK